MNIGLFCRDIDQFSSTTYDEFLLPRAIPVLVGFCGVVGAVWLCRKVWTLVVLAVCVCVCVCVYVCVRACTCV